MTQEYNYHDSLQRHLIEGKLAVANEHKHQMINKFQIDFSRLNKVKQSQRVWEKKNGEIFSFKHVQSVTEAALRGVQRGDEPLVALGTTFWPHPLIPVIEFTDHLSIHLR